LVIIVKARTQDLQAVLTLLKEVNLPDAGVSDHFHNYFVTWDCDQLVGCTGIEIYEEVGLIRSVAVQPSFQGHGLGRKLVETIHPFALEKKLTEVYLLTETAEQFFLKQDYIERKLIHE
jgi:amino-acid N-acetyltransferase